MAYKNSILTADAGVSIEEGATTTGAVLARQNTSSEQRLAQYGRR